MIETATSVELESGSRSTVQAAISAYKEIHSTLAHGPDGNRVLLDRFLEARLYELETLELYRHSPAAHLGLSGVSSLLPLDCGSPAERVSSLVDELERLPQILAAARSAVDEPIANDRVRSKSATSWLRQLLEASLPYSCSDDPLAARLGRAGRRAVAALEEFSKWLDNEALHSEQSGPLWGERTAEMVASHDGLVRYSLDAAIELGSRRTARLETRLTEALSAEGLDSSSEILFRASEPVAGWAAVAKDLPGHFEWARSRFERLVPKDFRIHIPTGVRLRASEFHATLEFENSGSGSTASREALYAPISRGLGPLSSLVADDSLLAFNPTWVRHRLFRELVEASVRASEASRAATPYRSLCAPGAIGRFFEARADQRDQETDDDALARIAAVQLQLLEATEAVLGARLVRDELSLEDAQLELEKLVGLPSVVAEMKVQEIARSAIPPGCELLLEEELTELEQAFLEGRSEGAARDDFGARILESEELYWPGLVERLSR